MTNTPPCAGLPAWIPGELGSVQDFSFVKSPQWRSYCCPQGYKSLALSGGYMIYVHIYII